MKSYFIYGKTGMFWNNIKHAWQMEPHVIPSKVLKDMQEEILTSGIYSKVDGPAAVQSYACENQPNVFCTIEFENEKEKNNIITALGYKKEAKVKEEPVIEEPKELPKKVQKNSNREDDGVIVRQPGQSNRKPRRRYSDSDNW